MEFRGQGIPGTVYLFHTLGNSVEFRGQYTYFTLQLALEFRGQYTYFTLQLA